jgi:hypothetical protein
MLCKLFRFSELTDRALDGEQTSTHESAHTETVCRRFARDQHTPNRGKSKIVISMPDITKAETVNGKTYHENFVKLIRFR